MPTGEGEGTEMQTLGAGPRGESDESMWRGRALQAEEKIKELEKSLSELRTELESAKAALEGMQKRRELEQQLIDAKAQDVETALMLVEKTLAKSPDQDIGRAVADVKQRKPHLFEPPAPRASGAGGASPGPDYAGAVEEAFTKARRSGGTRRSLLDYLRAKRRG